MKEEGRGVSAVNGWELHKAMSHRVASSLSREESFANSFDDSLEPDRGGSTMRIESFKTGKFQYGGQ